MSEHSPSFEDAIDVLVQRLPTRALATLREEQLYPEGTFDVHEINDLTITDLLIANRINIRLLITAAANAISNTAEGVVMRDPFTMLDEQMRGSLNPLLNDVRALACKYIGY